MRRYGEAYLASLSQLYLVNSDNFKDAVFTAEAYKQFRCLLSTGDFHTHTAVLISNPTDDQICDALYYDEDEQAFVNGAHNAG